jgi:DMSO/TMAO reductase YedYZ molybdopterin-dependent catalytic subunit
MSDVDLPADRSVPPPGPQPDPVPGPQPAPARTGRLPVGAGAGAGVLVAGLALGVAEFVHGAGGDAFADAASPVVGVGGAVIDRVPRPVKDWAIDVFGTADKVALVVGTVALLALAAAAIGMAATRRRLVAPLGIGAFAAVGAAAVWSRPGTGVGDALPTLLGALAAWGALAVLLGPRPTRTATSPAVGPAVGPAAGPARSPHVGAPAGAAGSAPRVGGPDRRRFLVAGAATASLAVITGTIGRTLRDGAATVAARAGLRLPTPARPAPPLPDGLDPVPGVSPFLTPTRQFFRIDTALVVPRVDPDGWRLRIHGMVEREVSITLDELLARPLVERHLTIACVSNEVGGRLIGTARWLGVPLADLLAEAGVDPAADQLVSRSVDGFTAGSPVAVVRDGRDALVAVGMNGEPLPARHGFPARLVVPGLYGYVSATKWLSELELTTFAAFDPYWIVRGWSAEGPVKTSARIDTPQGRLPVGPTVIAGVAWAMHRGIDRVEVSVDEGPWQPANLAPATSVDTWRQWWLPWDATRGGHRLRVRAVDGTGTLQTEERADVFPDGATGWHRVLVEVE